MFPSEPERQETPAQRDRRRAREGRGREGLKQVVLAMVVIFGSIASLAAADVVGVDRRKTKVTVVGLHNRWHARQCVTELTTGYGDAEIYSRMHCHDLTWRIGDTAEVEARQLRFTRIVVVSTRGTIFDGAYSFLPES